MDHMPVSATGWAKTQARLHLVGPTEFLNVVDEHFASAVKD
jgi:hypothetical protein